jgi:hypothetical protein
MPGRFREGLRWRRPPQSFTIRSRYDRRFYAVGAIVLAAAIAGKLLGADVFSEYPAVEVGAGPETLALSLLLVLSSLAPLRGRARRG